MTYEVIAIAAVLVADLCVSTCRAYLAELRDRAERLEREHDQTSALAAAVDRTASPARCTTAWPTTSHLRGTGERSGSDDLYPTLRAPEATG